MAYPSLDMPIGMEKSGIRFVFLESNLVLVSGSDISIKEITDIGGNLNANR